MENCRYLVEGRLQPRICSVSWEIREQVWLGDLGRPWKAWKRFCAMLNIQLHSYCCPNCMFQTALFYIGYHCRLRFSSQNYSKAISQMVSTGGLSIQLSADMTAWQILEFQKEQMDCTIFNNHPLIELQLSHSYMTTGKITALTIWTFFWQSNVSAF